MPIFTTVNLSSFIQNLMKHILNFDTYWCNDWKFKSKLNPFLHMFCEDNKLPWWGGLKHIMAIAIIIILKNGEGKGKNNITYSQLLGRYHFFHQTPLNIGVILSNTPFSLIELPSFYGISFCVCKENSMNSNHMHHQLPKISWIQTTFF